MSDGLFTPDKETFERFAKEWIERTKKAMIYGTSYPEIFTTDPNHGIEKLEPSDEVLKEIERLRAENEKLRNAIAAERERCARIAEKGDDGTCWTASERTIAAEIRESGE